MKKTILSLFGLCLLGITTALVLSSSSGGRAFAANSGNTGAPGESTTCVNCHGSGFATTVSMTVKDINGTVVSSYSPGSIYTVDFTVNSNGGTRWGYQVTSIDNSNLPVNTFSTPSSNTRIVTLGGGRQYAEHAGKSTSNSFSVDWTAPASGTGSVTFYGGGVAVNNNGSRTGDGAGVATIVLTEDSIVGIEEIHESAPVLFYPNPTKGLLTVETPVNYKNANISLVNKRGQVVFKQRMTEGSVHQINTENYRNGVYLLRVETKEQSFVSKVIFK